MENTVGEFSGKTNDKVKIDVRLEEERVRAFQILGLPTVLFAILATFCMYDSRNNIFMPVFAICSIIYIRLILKKLEIALKKGWQLYALAILLLGISDCLTGSIWLAALNNLIMFNLYIGMLLYIMYEQKGWTITKYFASLMEVIIGAIECIGDLFSDINVTIKKSKNNKTKTGLYCLMGIVIFIPIALIILPLLSSADAVFNSLLKDLWERFVQLDQIFWRVFWCAIFFIASYSGMRFFEKRNISEAVTEKIKWPSMVVNTVLTLINIIYLMFSCIQILSLFLGKLELPRNYTYAEYAREGFFQLMFVCFINLCFVLFSKAFFAGNKFTKLMLCVMSACTYIMIASSAMRLYLYVSVYGFTVLRLEVIFALVVISISMAFIIASVFNDKFNLMHALAISGIIVYLIFSLGRPDAIVASYNLNNSNVEVDYEYLKVLSSDAAPYMSKVEGVYHDSYFHNLELEKDTWKQFNISRQIARLYVK